jgi:hypothetical protein
MIFFTHTAILTKILNKKSVGIAFGLDNYYKWKIILNVL